MEKPEKEKTPLRQFREELGLTRRQVQEQTGIAERTLAYIEASETQPSHEYLVKLARLYKKSLKQMYVALGIDVTGVPDDLITR